MGKAEFRPERFVLSVPMAKELGEQGMRLTSIEHDRDGSATLTFEPDEVDFSGCAAVGTQGYHSESFGDENGRCEWCGQSGPIQTGDTP